MNLTTHTLGWKIIVGWLALVLAACAPAKTAPQPAIAVTTTPASDQRSADSTEFGLSLNYPAGLAESVSIQQVAAAPLSPNAMFAEAHPAYISAVFEGYNLKRPYRLAYPVSQPQVMVYRTSDFAAYANQSEQDFPSQQQKLAALLASGIGQERCINPPTTNDDRMPYLPWTNAAQVFCAQLKTLSFDNGKGSGIRYLTTFSQGIEPVLEGTVFYTFQGLSKDGQVYVSAVFPVETGVFSLDASESGGMGLEQMRGQLASQIGNLNGRGADGFNPSLDALDAVVESIELKE